MRESVTEVAVGALVIIVAGGFLAYAAQATGYTRGGGDMTLTASFRSVEGVSVGTDVRLAGVKIGSVTGMDLNAQTYRADTVMTLSNDVPIPNDSSAVVASEGLLGGNFIEIVPGGSMDNFAPGEEIVDTQGAVSLLQLLLTYVGGGTRE
ncbi:MAG: outer membrane lipid asymmetry maintenance protein MlaD [Flavimaricola sp.]|nr:outer membrane lipid asymmetry maintenance protein MlaD [Flavimaricola sp.]